MWSHLERGERVGDVVMWQNCLGIMWRREGFFNGIVSSRPKTVGGNQNFRKISCGGGNWIFLSFYYVKGFLWAGKLGWESQNPDFSVGVGDPTP